MALLEALSGVRVRVPHCILTGNNRAVGVPPLPIQSKTDWPLKKKWPVSIIADSARVEPKIVQPQTQKNAAGAECGATSATSAGRANGQRDAFHKT